MTKNRFILLLVLFKISFLLGRRYQKCSLKQILNSVVLIFDKKMRISMRDSLKLLKMLYSFEHLNDLVQIR